MQQRFFELIPPGTKIRFVGNRWRYVSVSLVAMAICLASMVYNHFARGAMLNFGIDFAGGSQVRLAFDSGRGPDIAEVRASLEGFGYEGSSVVSVPDAENEVLIRVKDTVAIDEKSVGACEDAVRQVGAAKLVEGGFSHPSGGSKIFLQFDAKPVYAEVERALAAAGCEGRADKGFGRDPEASVEVSLIGIGAKIKEQLDQRFGAGTVAEIILSETVGSKVGDQLKVDGVVAMLYAIAFIFLYVMVRFDLRFAPGGIIALAHDAFLVVGAFALTWREFNLQIVAAVLTVIGYSINDTIVVFDRIRERVSLFREQDIEATTDASLNDTLSRTLLTSGTTLFVVLAVYFLGSGPIKDFAFALIIGLVVGTYSSLYVAAPIFLWVNRRFYAGRGHLGWQAEGAGGPVLAAGADEVDEESGRTVGELRDERAEGGEPGEGPRKASRRRRRPRPADPGAAPPSES